MPPAAPEEETTGRVYSQRKQEFKATLEEYMDKYQKVLVVDADNVGSNQMHQIRRALRGKAIVVMGKNTLIRFIITNYAKQTGNDSLNSLAELCRLNVGLVFTNEDLIEVRDLLTANRVEAPARVGALAPKDVSIPAGPTGLEPTQTSFFQALQVPTKIVKGSIEILSDVHLIKAGDKCGPSEVALLNKLGICPFSYGLQLQHVWDNGSVYSSKVLDITADDVSEALSEQIQRMACISLASGYLTAPAVPHLVINGFKNLLAVAVETEYSFPEGDKVKEILANPGAFAAAAAPAAGGSAPAAAKAPEPEEEEEEEMGFSLFD